MEREDDRGAPAGGALHTARVDKRNKLGGMDGDEVLTLAASVTVDAQGSASDTYIASSSTTGDGVANEGAMSAVEVALIALAVGDDKFGSIGEVPEGFSVMAGLDPATHAVRRVERPRVSCYSPKNFAFAGSCCGPRQCGASLCGASAWMAGSSPAMTTVGPERNRQWPDQQLTL